MEYKVEKLLTSQPGLKARKIAQELGVEKKVINAVLYGNESLFTVDESYCWSLRVPTLVMEFPASGWLTSEDFENIVSEYPPLCSTEVREVKLVFKGGKLLLDSLSRLLALVNQLAYQSKSVMLDFSASKESFSYLCRVGFFELIHRGIKITPKLKDASCHYGNSHKVMEFGVIDPKWPDEKIPRQLKQAFIAEAGKEHSNAAFTIISELFGNVRDHSNSPLDGFAALQVYCGKKKHIQTVISDSGDGIAGTLRPILAERYPELHRKYSALSPESDALLVKEVFEKGKISSAENNEDESRGLGLKRSGDMAARFDAKIFIRQEDFELTLIYKQGRLANHNVRVDLQKLKGTHICFDFFLD